MNSYRFDFRFDWLSCFWCLFVFFVAISPAFAWPTYRGNPQRTANTDGVAGPTAPRVLWVLKSQEHFIASPVPAGDKLLISGLGAFNVASLHALNIDPKAEKRIAWTKSTPYLKLPTVSSPAVVDGKLIFGDGMHQTDGAILHCLRLDGTLPLWQQAVPGTLVHLEGSPTVDQKRVIIGGGNAGVIAVDLERVTLDGKDEDLATIQKVLEKKWKELLARYEEDKKKDPDFAVPPSEDQLPRPAPKRLWQQGKDKWHVDAPVVVVGDRVLVGSAFLDKEQVGDRALYCLDAASGDIRWKAALRLNPWGGPSVAGNLVVIAGSTINYDPKALKAGKGEIAAFDLADGKEKWRKEVPGGIVACVALADGLAIATATDGKVRAFDVQTGDRRWIYEAKTPLFAPAAVAAGVAYVGDLRGVLHAIKLADGQPAWTLDLGTDPQVQAPGMIYGGPVLHGGRLYVATCNLDGAFVGKPTAVVCIGQK